MEDISIEKLAKEYIKKIKDIQPKGPYYLAGWSLGGLIAYEIALRIIENKDEVRFIGMIDTFRPGEIYRREPIDFNDTKTILKMLIKHLELQGTIDERTVATLETMEDLSEAINFLKEIKALRKSVKISDIYKLISRSMNLGALPITYEPAQIAGKVNIFAAAKTMEYDPFLGWTDFLSDNWSIHRLQGDHASIMRAPNVKDLACVMEQCMFE